MSTASVAPVATTAARAPLRRAPGVPAPRAPATPAPAETPASQTAPQVTADEPVAPPSPPVEKTRIIAGSKVLKIPVQKTKEAALVNFLNSIYKTMDGPKTTFEAHDLELHKREEKAKKSGKPAAALEEVIDLSNYIGLGELRDRLNANPELPMTQIIENTFDLRLRSALDIADKYNLTNPKFNVLVNELVPQLGIPEADVNINTYINGITDYLNDTDHFRLKMYNKYFPHSLRNPGDVNNRLNVIYLQRGGKHQDKVLELIGAGKSERDILLELQKSYPSGYKFDKEPTPERKKICQIQLGNPKLVDHILGMTSASDTKFINDLHQITLQGTESAELVTPEMKKNIRELIKDLWNVRSMYKVITDAMNDNKDVPYAECLKNYNAAVKHLVGYAQEKTSWVAQEFNKIQSYIETQTAAGVAEDLINNDSCKMAYELFIRYFVDACRVVSEALDFYTEKPESGINAFLAEVRKFASYRLPRNLKQLLITITAQGSTVTEEIIVKIVDEHYLDWEFINTVRSLDPYSEDIYAKVGKLLGVSIDKSFRIAVGVAILSWVQQNIEVIRAANGKKKSVEIYIKA